MLISTRRNGRTIFVQTKFMNLFREHRIPFVARIDLGNYAIFQSRFHIKLISIEALTGEQFDTKWLFLHLINVIEHIPKKIPKMRCNHKSIEITPHTCDRVR